MLQAVMAELRGGPRGSPSFPRPKGVIPARRGSSADDAEQISFKRRQTNRTKSFSTVRSSMSVDLSSIHLNTMRPPKHGADSDVDRADSFLLATPHSDISGWPGSADTTGLSTHSFSTPGATTTTTTATSTGLSSPTNRPGSAWMGPMSALGSDMDGPDISSIASAHFPEIMHLPDPAGHDTNPNSHLDFLNLGGDDWKTWDAAAAVAAASSGNGAGPGGTSDLDGFPSSAGGFGPPFSAGSPAAVAILNA